MQKITKINHTQCQRARKENKHYSTINGSIRWHDLSREQSGN